MDNFMDRLVEKINAQGAMRMQNMINLQEGVPGKNNPGAAVDEKLKENHEAIVKDVTESTASVVSETNARNAELFTEYKKQSEEELIKVKDELADHMHKESVKCYRNTQAVIEEKAGSQEAALKETVNRLKILLIAGTAIAGVDLIATIVILLRLFRLI